MSIPTWALLGFALWTVLLLFFTVGIYRWSRILTGRVEIKEFRADHVKGEDWYRRSMRAHANCIENLPIFTVLVFVMYVTKISALSLDAMAVTVLLARICQSLVHVSFIQTNRVALVRFLFFLIQVLCFLGMSAVLIYRLFS